MKELDGYSVAGQRLVVEFSTGRRADRGRGGSRGGRGGYGDRDRYDDRDRYGDRRGSGRYRYARYIFDSELSALPAIPNTR